MAKFAERLCQNAPKLQSLEISRLCACLGPIFLPPDWLVDVPSLQDLKFYHVSPGTVSTFFLPKLTRIHLDDFSAEPARLRLEDLLDLFELTPLVEVISFHVLVQNLTGKPLKKLTLENLGELEWTDFKGLNSLAPYIIAPKLTRLRIDVTDKHDSHHQPTTASPFFPSDRVHIPLLSEPTTVVYCCKVMLEQCTLRYPIDDHELEVKYESHENSGVWFSHLFPPFSFLKVQELEVVSISAVRDSLVNFPIGEFENLEKLLLEGDFGELFQMLGPNSGEPVPCTMLSEIHLSADLRIWRSTLKTLKDVLGRRKEAGYKVKTLRIPRFKFSTRNTKALKALVDEAILGGEELGRRISCWFV